MESTDARAEPAALDPRAPAILLLTYISPLQRWGSAIRSRYLIEALQRHGRVDVLVITFVDRVEPSRVFSARAWRGTVLMEIQVERRGLRGRSRFDLASHYVTRCITDHLDFSQYDLIVSRYVRPALKLHLPACVPVIVDFDDAVYSPPWRSLGSVRTWGGIALRLINEHVLDRWRLRGGAPRFNHFFFCQEREQAAYPGLPSSLLRNLPPRRRAPTEGEVLPTQPSGEGQRSGPPTLMFVGLLDYMPNHDAVDWFLAEAWPRVRREMPDARFLIVGSGEERTVAPWRGVPGVELTGFVEDIAEAYARADVCVVPLRSGAGANIKTLEPYQYGRMVVATPLAIEHHRPLLRPGIDILVAGDAEGFASLCIEMLREPHRAMHVARSGHDRIQAQATTEHFNAVVDAAVLEAMSAGKQADTGGMAPPGTASGANLIQLC